MKTHTGYWLACLLLAVPFHQAGAQACEIRKQATLPITFIGQVPTVPVTINGQTMNIGLDTGAQTTSVIPELATRLHLSPAYRHYDARITSVTGKFNTVRAIANSLLFAGEEYKKRIVTVIPLLNKPNRMPVTGLLGVDILSDFDMEYDPLARTVTLFHATNCPHVKPPWAGKYVSLPGAVADTNRFTIPVLLDGHALTGILDTGAAHTVIALSSARGMGMTADMLAHDPVYDSTGGGAMISKLSLHRFDSFAIAHEQLRGPFISVINFSPGEADMLIGEDYMLARRFWLSYATGTLFIQLQADAAPQTAKGQAALGFSYLSGNWVPKDADKALTWIRKAAEQDDPLAESTLGRMFHAGMGVEKNDAEAVKWWKASAEQGNEYAQFSLGESYVTGRGTPTDYVSAYKWASLAAARAEHGSRNSAVLKEPALIAEMMTPDELSKARGQIEEWKQRHPHPLPDVRPH